MRIIWYPDDLFWMDGGWQGLQIIAPIDLVLGPALTLCFYRPWKKNLKFDMAVIAAVQIAALGYGVLAAYNQRPAVIVFAESRFETLALSEYRAASKEMRENGVTPVSLRDFGSRMPAVVHARAFNKDEFGDYLADLLNGLPELRERSDRYQPIADGTAEITKYRIGSQQSGTSIANRDESDDVVEIPASSRVTDTREHTSTVNQPEIYKLKARYENGTIEFDPGNFKWTRITREAQHD